jgi:hypothetical protein
MPQYMVQLTHSDEHDACVRALEMIERYGSHLMTHINWGCRAGVHSGWMILEFANREEALQIVPPQFREEARVIEVNQFSREDIADMVARLEK